MHIIVKVVFFETHMINVRCKLVCLRCIMMCHNDKKLKFKLTRTLMVGGPKLNLVLMDQMKNGKYNGRGSIGAIPRNLWEAREDGPPLNHIGGKLVRYKDVFTNVLPKWLPPRNEKQLCSTSD